MKRRRGQRSGFTLIELLVVIALLGMTTTLGMTILYRVSEAWRQTTIRAELDAKADYILSQMGQDFAQVVSAQVSGQGIRGSSQTAQDPRFFGVPLQDDVVVLPVTLSPEPGELPRQVDVGYHIDREEGAHTLVRTTTIPGNTESVASVKVSDGVLAMRIEYAAKAPGSAWQSPWSNAALPGAVRISLTLADPDRPYEQIARKAVFPIYVD